MMLDIDINKKYVDLNRIPTEDSLVLSSKNVRAINGPTLTEVSVIFLCTCMKGGLRTHVPHWYLWYDYKEPKFNHMYISLLKFKEWDLDFAKLS